MNLLELPVDQYQRYRMAADIANVLRGDKRVLKILEVGGYPPKLDKFLPDDHVTITDREKDDASGYVRADALSLPFADKSFDMTFSLDVLEHISPEKRGKYVTELTRVSEAFSIVAAPFDDSRMIKKAEKLIHEYIQAALGYDHQFFREHLEYGLPNTEYIIDIFGDYHFDSIALPNGYFPNWINTIMWEYGAELNPALKEIAPRLREFYNYYFYQSDNREPAYRHFIIAKRDQFTSAEKEALVRLMSDEAPSQWPPAEYAAAVVEMTRLQAGLRAEERIKGLEHDLAAREEELSHLRQYANELEGFVKRVKSAIPYQVYKKFIKH